MTPTTDSIVTWTTGRTRRLGRVLGIQGAAAIIRDTDGVIRTVWCDALTPAAASPRQLHLLGVTA